MSETVRGVIVFVAALFTIALWVPLSGEGRAREGGGSVNEIYFGLFRYLVVHSEMKEPDFKITKELQPVRLAANALVDITCVGRRISRMAQRRPSAPDVRLHGRGEHMVGRSKRDRMEPAHLRSHHGRRQIEKHLREKARREIRGPHVDKPLPVFVQMLRDIAPRQLFEQIGEIAHREHELVAPQTHQ